VVTVQELVRNQTPVVVLVALLDGTLRQRVGVITGLDNGVMRVYDFNRDKDGSVKGFRSTPWSHVVRVEPLPANSPAFNLVRRSAAAAYVRGPQ